MHMISNKQANSPVTNKLKLIKNDTVKEDNFFQMVTTLLHNVLFLGVTIGNKVLCWYKSYCQINIGSIIKEGK